LLMSVFFCTFVATKVLTNSMKYSILHISDIHRGEQTDLNNLFESLVRDAEEYVKEGIVSPSIIVVSGDIAEGDNSAGAEAIIRAQYKEAAIFLDKLVEHFLKGNKSRIIIVPGNHDMYRGMSESSMVKYIMRDGETVRALMRKKNLRWSWNSLCFYRISQPDIYAKRFDLFVEFYNQFYNGIRSIEGVPDEYSDVVDMPEYNISFVLFNSCYKLDHLRFTGAIFPSAVMSQSRKLRELSRAGRLIIGVWHHHINGLPEENNYMDYRVLQPMVSNHVHIGLFGHQHYSQIINQYTSVEEERQMLLISAGSLYGGYEQLAPGCTRQYNVIEVDMLIGKADITVNERMDTQPNYEIPDWKMGPIGKHLQQKSYTQSIELEQVNFDSKVMALDNEVNKTQDYNAAIWELYRQYKDSPRYDELLDRYLSKSTLPNWDMVVVLEHPRTEVQAILYLGAIEELGQQEMAEKAIREEYICQSDSSMVKELRNNIVSKFNIK